LDGERSRKLPSDIQNGCRRIIAGSFKELPICSIYAFRAGNSGFEQLKDYTPLRLNSLRIQRIMWRVHDSKTGPAEMTH